VRFHPALMEMVRGSELVKAIHLHGYNPTLPDFRLRYASLVLLNCTECAADAWRESTHQRKDFKTLLETMRKT